MSNKRTAFLVVTKRKAGDELLEDEVAVKRPRWNALQDQHDGLTRELKSSTSENALLSKELERLRDGIAKLGNGKVKELLLIPGLWNDIVAWFKEGPFRNNKFFQNDKHRDKLVKQCWEYFKESLNLEKAPHNLNLRKFRELYTKAVLEGQSKARQYIQSQAQNPCEGKSCLVLRLIRHLLPLTKTNLTLTCLPLSLARVVQQTRDLAYHRRAFGCHQY